MSFQDAKTLMQSQGIKTNREFIEWKKAGKRPEDFPSNPQKTYKDRWKGWGNFLGTGNISNRKRKWMSFDKAKAFIQSQKIRTRKQFQEWSKSEQRPKDFPSHPQKTYKNRWKGWGNFLGTGNISTRKREKGKWMSFDKAKTFVQQLGITNLKDFFEEMKNNSDIFPENFPPNPKAFYTNTGEWVGWNDFLGLTIKSHSKINNSGESFQIKEGELGQEDIFTDAEEGSKWGENVEI